MPCFSPIEGWRSLDPNDNGKHYFTKTWRLADKGHPLEVACGKCDGCTARKAQEWGIRCYHESLQHKRNAFLTLTYDDNNCPPELVKSDLSIFIRELRRELYPDKIRYFGCGEYGEETHRPHYHLLVFGADFLGGATKIQDKSYYNPFLHKI